MSWKSFVHIWKLATRTTKSSSSTVQHNKLFFLFQIVIHLCCCATKFVSLPNKQYTTIGTIWNGKEYFSLNNPGLHSKRRVWEWMRGKNSAKIDNREKPRLYCDVEENSKSRTLEALQTQTRMKIFCSLRLLYVVFLVTSFTATHPRGKSESFFAHVKNFSVSLS